MAGLRPGLAEVVQRGDEAGAEMMLPDAIDQHTSEQRILRRCDPAREGRAPSRADATFWPRLEVEGVLVRAKRGGNTGLHLGSRRGVLATLQDVVRRRVGIGFDEDGQLLQRA